MTCSLPREQVLFLRQYIRGDDMNRLIARLIDCGMPREIALFMYGKYKRARKLDEFEIYVESVEESQREQLEAI